MKRCLAAVLLALFFAGAQAEEPTAQPAAQPTAQPNSQHRAGNPRGYPHDVLLETFGFTQEDSDVPLDHLFQGCPARDCIPAIEAPEFVSVSKAGFLRDDDLVLGVKHNGVTRAYAANILNHHEIVNDDFNGEPVVVTYCPLCGSGVAFLRTLDGVVMDFGVSGVLHNNDLVLYDRQSESLWQQITGEAFAGPGRGKTLQAIPVAMSFWRDWRDANPTTQVLAPPTDSDRDYSGDRMAKYQGEIPAKRQAVVSGPADGRASASKKSDLWFQRGWQRHRAGCGLAGTAGRVAPYPGRSRTAGPHHRRGWGQCHR
jgi:hypothetical protein